MVSLDILKKRGCTVEAIKALAIKAKPLASKSTADTATEAQADQGSPKEKFQNFQDRLWMRIQSGRDYNRRHWKDFHAIDLALDSAFHQVTPTLVQSLIDSDPSSAEVEGKLQAWGINLNSVIEDIPDPKDPTKRQKRFNINAFNEIKIGLVKSYTTIRHAKIMNDRRTVPFLPYNPAISTVVSRMQCEAISDRVEVMNNQMGYFDAVSQATFQCLAYGYSFLFPMEEWYREVQEVETKKASHFTDKENGRFYRVTKEGIRHNCPHPAKTYSNRAYKPSTINTDTGVDYSGYNRIMPFKDLRENEGFWNRDAISFGNTTWWTEGSAYFDAIFGGCVISPPSAPSGGAGAPTGNDREVQNAMFYNQSMDDKSVMVTEHFEKAVPKEIGIGDYDCPVWFRWVVAGDGTIVYGAPLGYSPLIYFHYDQDANRERNASLALEILPFQDHVSNLISQFLLTVKQNLTNVNFYDADVVDEGAANLFKNFGQKFYQAYVWIKYNGHKLKKTLGSYGSSTTTGIDKVFHSHRFQPQDTSGQLQGIKVCLELLERVLTMSSAEAGQAASHELRKDEVAVINNSSSSRLKFTGIPVDQGMDTMKIQLYEALMNYGEADFVVAVSHTPELDKKKLEEIGFEFIDDSILDRRDKKAPLRVKRKDALLINAFMGHRDSIDRTNNGEVAVSLAQMLAAWLSNPAIFQVVGAEQTVELVNKINQLAGMPRDFILKADGNGQAPGAPPEDFQKQVAMAIQNAMQQVKKDVVEGIQPLMAHQEGLDQRIMAIERALQQIVGGPQIPPGNEPPIEQGPTGPGNPV